MAWNRSLPCLNRNLEAAPGPGILLPVNLDDFFQISDWNILRQTSGWLRYIERHDFAQKPLHEALQDPKTFPKRIGPAPLLQSSADRSRST